MPKVSKNINIYIKISNTFDIVFDMLCLRCEENFDHLLIDCEVGIQTWNVVFRLLNSVCHTWSLMTELWMWLDNLNMSSSIKTTIEAIIMTILMVLRRFCN